MYDMLSSQFKDALSREGKIVTSTVGESYTCLFRTNADKNKSYNRVTIFYMATENIEQGQLLKFKDRYYIVLNKETPENEVYYKSDLLEVNAQIHTISNGYELYINCYAEDFTSVNPVNNAQLSVVGGNISFMASDNMDTRQLSINNTFTALDVTWKIVNIYYKSGICYIYVQRTTDNPSTPTYALTITGSDSFKVDDTGVLSAVATITDGANITTIVNPTISWSSSDNAIATVTSAGQITAISSGTTTITATWVEHGITATKDITVQSDVSYSATIAPTNSSIATGRSKTFTVTFTDNTGAAVNLTPVWSLTLPPEVSSSYVTISATTENKANVKVAYQDAICGYEFQLNVRDTDNLCNASTTILIE